MLLTLAIACCAPGMAAFAADGAGEPVLHLNEEFENYYGGIPVGWTVSSEQNIFPVELKGGAGRCARLMSSQEMYDANMQLTFAPALKGKIVMETKVYPTDVLHRRALFTFKDSTNLENLTVMFNNDGYITVGEPKTRVMMYQPETWYHVQVLIDTETKKMDLYINGEKKVSDFPLVNQAIEDIWILRFGQWDRDNADFYIDDIMVYEYDRPLTEEEKETYFSIHFNDIAGHWAESYIQNFADLKLVENTEDGRFRPDDTITNAECAELLCSIMRFTGREYINVFSDVSVQDAVAAPVQALVDAGVITGDEGKFYPDALLTLGSASNILVETYKYVKQELPGIETMEGKELQQIGDWARDYIGQAKYLHLYDGVKSIKNNQINEEATLTRAEFAVMVSNLLEAVK